jgi:hypothetical protein
MPVGLQGPTGFIRQLRQAMGIYIDNELSGRQVTLNGDLYEETDNHPGDGFLSRDYPSSIAGDYRWHNPY